MAKSEYADLLAGVELFEGLSRKELAKVLRFANEERFAGGECLIAEGDASGRMFVVVEGEADVTVGDRLVATLKAGEAAGELALIDRQPRSASVVARTPVVALSLASFHFRPLLREHPALAEKVLLMLCRRLRQAQDRPAD